MDGQTDKNCQMIAVTLRLRFAARVNYVKPGATFCDELPLNKPSTRSIQTFIEASEFLKGYDRQIHPHFGGWKLSVKSSIMPSMWTRRPPSTD